MGKIPSLYSIGLLTNSCPQGGFLFISTDYLDQVNAATMKFMSGVDPKASIITNYEYSNGTVSSRAPMSFHLVADTQDIAISDYTAFLQRAESCPRGFR